MWRHNSEWSRQGWKRTLWHGDQFFIVRFPDVFRYSTIFHDNYKSNFLTFSGLWSAEGTKIIHTFTDNEGVRRVLEIDKKSEVMTFQVFSWLAYIFPDFFRFSGERTWTPCPVGLTWGPKERAMQRSGKYYLSNNYINISLTYCIAQNAQNIRKIQE